jgi:deoxycytidine triphosphate deaminase
MTVLNHQEILRRCREEKLIGGFKPGMCKGASYDLTLGDEYYIFDSNQSPSTKFKVIPLNSKESLKIPPGEVCYAITSESLNMPDDLTAILSLPMGLIKKGLMLTKQPPIDQGYKGKIVCMLYNLSANDVSIKRGEKILTIEFIKLNAPSDVEYQGTYQGLQTLNDFLEEPITSGLHQLRIETQRTYTDFMKRIPVILQWIVIIIAIMTFLKGMPETVQFIDLRKSYLQVISEWPIPDLSDTQ